MLYDDLKPFWGLFVELCISRTNNGFEQNPIQYSEIESLLNIYDIKEPETRRRATELIKLIDVIYLKNSKPKPEKKVKSNAPRS